MADDRIRIRTQTEMASELKSGIRALWQADASLSKCALTANRYSIEPDKQAGSIPEEFGILDTDAKELYVLVDNAFKALRESVPLRELMERIG